MSDASISLVVIGFNEAQHLPACLDSAVALRDAGAAVEVVYVDGGSTDGSRDIAHERGVDAVLGSSVRRSAAVNRNIGWRHAKGDLIQFLDADMEIELGWLDAASQRLNADPNCAVVCGEIRERRQSFWARVAQLDWRRAPGEVAYCGGAALFRRSALEATGGFPEDVAYGEEPLLCWRIRNDLGHTIEYLAAPMVTHDLAYGGFGGYWRRCKRVGQTQAAIAARCWNTPDPLWRREVVRGLGWPVLYVLVGVVIAIAPLDFKLVGLILAAFVLVRKAAQTLDAGQPFPVACGYAVHTYFAKIPIAAGIAGWWLNRGQSS